MEIQIYLFWTRASNKVDLFEYIFNSNVPVYRQTARLYF